jgi:hypothetical protein
MDIYQRAVLDVDIPVGRYSRRNAVNLGTNTYDLHPYYAVTAFPTKRMETSWRVYYLWNSTNQSPPLSTGARSMQAGQAIHFNATAAYNIRGGLWLGVNGYYFSQITDGRINGGAVRDSPERVGAVGPGMVWNSGKWFLYANGYREVVAENRPAGGKIVLRLEKVF